MSEVTHQRRAKCSLLFNGHDVSEFMDPYIKQLTYTDVAGGSSDEIEITLWNYDLMWLDTHKPKLGDMIGAAFALYNWNRAYSPRVVPLGRFTVDSMRFSGGPLQAEFGALSVPADSSFRIRERTQTWQDVTLSGIAGEIAGRYGLKLEFSGEDASIAAREQSQQTDSAYLLQLVEDYGLRLKIHSSKLVIYDPGELEAKNPAATLTRESWIDDGWSAEDNLYGVYTGARIGYKNPDSSSDDISIYVGRAAEDAPEARTLFINERCDSEGDAIRKAKAQVNESNESLQTMSGDIWPNPNICAGVTVQVDDLGTISGKWFVDTCVWTLAGSGTKQHLAMHKVQERL